jgi:hypothetical protein
MGLTIVAEGRDPYRIKLFLDQLAAFSKILEARAAVNGVPVDVDRLLAYAKEGDKIVLVARVDGEEGYLRILARIFGGWDTSVYVL